MVQIVFKVFPLVLSMASNADSLVLFDLAHDVLYGKVLRFWNLPRATYLFPDTIIAIVVMVFGWFDYATISLVATINYALMLLVVHWVMQANNLWKHYALWQTGVVMSLALAILSLCFPFAMINIYWQLFASGAHCLTVVVVLAILHLLGRRNARPSAKLLIAISLLVFLESLSDSMAAVLLLVWIGAQVLWRLSAHYFGCSGAQYGRDAMRRNSHKINFVDLLAVFCSLLLGTLGGALLPRQSLVESFFSLDKFTSAIFLFWAWTVSSWAHAFFLALLLLVTLVFPLITTMGSKVDTKVDSASGFFSCTSYKTGFYKGMRWLCAPVVLPSLAILVMTPLLYQELGSLRYLIFTAVLLWIALATALLYWARKIRRAHAVVFWFGAALLISAMLGLAYWDAQKGLIGSAQEASGRDALGLSVGADARAALACLEQAQAQYPLLDGIATYWNARPTRFAANDYLYLAQINPWRPRAGYFLWGNNGVDFVYRYAPNPMDPSQSLGSYQDANTVLRSYNFLLATQAELDARLWGRLPAQATGSVRCAKHSVFYFDNPN
jgi:hypothetical protein